MTHYLAAGSLGCTSEPELKVPPVWLSKGGDSSVLQIIPDTQQLSASALPAADQPEPCWGLSLLLSDILIPPFDQLQMQQASSGIYSEGGRGRAG